MGEGKPAPISSDDEEARLRERLRAKKFKDDEEARLRERLKAKKSKQHTNSGSSSGKKGEENSAENAEKSGDRDDKDPKHKDVSPRNTNMSSNSHHHHHHRGRDRHQPSQPRRSGSRSRDRRSNSRGRRGSASSRDRRGPPPFGPGGPPPPGGFGNNGPPPPHGRGGPRRFFEQDPFGRAIRPGRGGGFAGGGSRQPPPPNNFRGPPGGGSYGPPRGPPPPGYYDQEPHGRDLARPHHHRHRRPHHHHRASRSRSRSLSDESYSSGDSRSVSRSSSRSTSRSRSRSMSDDDDGRRKRSRSNSSRRGSHKHHRRNGHRRRRQRSPSSTSEDDSEDSYSSSGSSSDEEDSDRVEGSSNNNNNNADAFTKDQRTVFVNQLVMRTKAKDISRYFRKQVGCKINDIILLRDKRTGRHKGCAYVEMRTMDDVAKALQVSGQPPDFQRFPLVIKPSEAEKNYLIPASSATLTSAMVLGPTASAKAPMIGPNGKPIESQQVYVGNLAPTVTQEHLFALFSQLGQLGRVSVQMDPATGLSKGYAFLSFRDPKESNLAIQAMSNQVLLGRPLKTGWASQNTSSKPGVEVVTSEEMPADAGARIQKARVVMAQLAIGAGLVTPATTVVGVSTVAEARANLAAAASGIMGVAGVPGISPATPPAAAAVGTPDAKIIKGAENPTPHLLVHNMFDKDEETEPGWAEDIRVEFQEECGQYGKLTRVVVMSQEPGGKIYASFEAVDGAKNCASALAGRWFDKRQLRVEYVQEDQAPAAAEVAPQKVKSEDALTKSEEKEETKGAATEEPAGGTSADAKPAATDQDSTLALKQEATD